MPVPVHHQPAHPVAKKAGRSPPQSLAVSPIGCPPSFATRDEWIGSLPEWRRNKTRRSWDQNMLLQDFHDGLAPAVDAPAIKGSRADAWIPPLTHHHSEPVPRRTQSLDVAYTLPSPPMAIDSMSLSSPIDAAFTDDCFPAHSLHSIPEGITSPPAMDAESPDADVASSPIGPLTPYGITVDHPIESHTEAYPEGSFYHAPADPQWGHNVPLCAPQLLDVHSVPQVILEEPKEPALAPEVVTPTASAEYRKMAEPMSEWVAKFIWKVCTTGMALPADFARSGNGSFKQFCGEAPSYLSGSIHSLLLSTLLEPSAILLSLRFITRLPVYFAAGPLSMDQGREVEFRMELLGDATGPDRDTLEATAPFRLAVLGFMLANKWLSDHTYSNKTWHSISNIPVASLNKLESMVLGIFQYDMSISTLEWTHWVKFIQAYHTSLRVSTYPQPISRPSSTPHSIVNKAIEEALTTEDSGSTPPQPVFIGLEQRRQARREKEYHYSMQALEIDLDEEGPLREEYLPKRRVSNASSYQSAQSEAYRAPEYNDNNNNLYSGKPLPPPAKWSPANDEPILRDSQRINGQHAAYPAIAPALHSLPTYYDSGRDCSSSNQNWPGYGYTAIKPVPTFGTNLPVPPLLPVYNQFSYAQSLALHSRSHSLRSYDLDGNSGSRSHSRSISQTVFDCTNKCAANMTAVPHLPFEDPNWVIPSYGPVPGAQYQSSWLKI